MTEPAAPLTPAWLDPAGVSAWLKISVPTEADTALLVQCAAAVEPQVEAARPDMWLTLPPVSGAEGEPPTRVYTPDAEVTTAAVMLAARLFVRRNSPGGVVTMYDQVVYASRYDDEIDKALRHGSHRRPVGL